MNWSVASHATRADRFWTRWRHVPPSWCWGWISKYICSLCSAHLADQFKSSSITLHLHHTLRSAPAPALSGWRVSTCHSLSNLPSADRDARSPPPRRGSWLRSVMSSAGVCAAFVMTLTSWHPRTHSDHANNAGLHMWSPAKARGAFSAWQRDKRIAGCMFTCLIGLGQERVFYYFNWVFSIRQ